MLHARHPAAPFMNRRWTASGCRATHPMDLCLLENGWHCSWNLRPQMRSKHLVRKLRRRRADGRGHMGILQDRSCKSSESRCEPGDRLSKTVKRSCVTLVTMRSTHVTVDFSFPSANPLAPTPKEGSEANYPTLARDGSKPSPLEALSDSLSVSSPLKGWTTCC
jgi:hypothetical protein